MVANNLIGHVEWNRQLKQLKKSSHDDFRAQLMDPSINSNAFNEIGIVDAAIIY